QRNFQVATARSVIPRSASPATALAALTLVDSFDRAGALPETHRDHRATAQAVFQALPRMPFRVGRALMVRDTSLAWTRVVTPCTAERMVGVSPRPWSVCATRGLSALGTALRRSHPTGARWYATPPLTLGLCITVECFALPLSLLLLQWAFLALRAP